jgi:hypothetical protein
LKVRNLEICQVLRYTKSRRKEPIPEIDFQGIPATTFLEKLSIFHQVLFPAPPVFQIPETTNLIIHHLLWPKVTMDEIKN